MEVLFFVWGFVNATFSLFLMSFGPSVSKSIIASLESELDVSKTWQAQNMGYLQPIALLVTLAIAKILEQGLPRFEKFQSSSVFFQRGVVTHTIKAILYTVALLSSLPAISKILLTGNASLNDQAILNEAMITPTILISIYIFELIYRDKLYAPSYFHHVTTIIVISSIQNGTTIIPGMLSASYVIWAWLQGIFCFLENIDHLALAFYKLDNNRPRVLHILAWTNLKIVLSCVASTGSTIMFYAMHYEFLPKSVKIFMPITACLFHQTQLYTPYVFLILIQKEAKKCRLSLNE